MYARPSRILERRRPRLRWVGASARSYPGVLRTQPRAPPPHRAKRASGTPAAALLRFLKGLHGIFDKGAAPDCFGSLAQDILPSPQGQCEAVREGSIRLRETQLSVGGLSLAGDTTGFPINQVRAAFPALQDDFVFFDNAAGAQSP